MTAAEIIGQVLAAGGQIAADGADLVLTAPRPLPDDLLNRLKSHKPAILAALAHPDLPGVSPQFAACLSAKDLEDIAVGDTALGTVQAFEQAAIAREAEDRREAFEEPPSWSSTPAYRGTRPSWRRHAVWRPWPGTEPIHGRPYGRPWRTTPSWPLRCPSPTAR